MKRLCFLAVAMAFAIGAAVRADDAPSVPRGSLGSGANLGQSLAGLGVPATPGNSPFSNGLGQIVSGWTHQGIHGPELAERIHWLQGMRADEIAERTRWLDQRRFGQDDRLRDWDRNRLGDIREDRRELRDDQRRLPRDRQDLHRDLGDREDRGLHRGWGDHEDRGLHRGWNNDHRSNVPAPKNSRNSVPFGKGKGRGKG